MCVLNATALATEVIKNLVLPGVGQFTLVDKQRVTGDAVEGVRLLRAMRAGRDASDTSLACVCVPVDTSHRAKRTVLFAWNSATVSTHARVVV